MNIQPNLIAYFALLMWPLVALCFYARLPIGRATLWTILVAYLLLPVDAEIKIQGVPTFNKDSIPSLAALIFCSIRARRLPKFFRGFGIAEVLLLALLIGPFITSVLNTDPIRIEKTFLPGIGSYEALSAAAGQFIFVVPFFLGRQFLRGSQDNFDILRIMVIAGLAYSLPILLEIRLSPQLHTWIYGYFPGGITGFATAMRDGGFRPVVFLRNGLLVAFFATTTTVAAAALWRTQTRLGRFSASWITAYLSFVSLLCKTASALLYGAVVVPLVRWASPRLQLGVATILVITALFYPLLRVADVFPTTSLVEVAAAVSVDRAGSLKTRFDNEDQLLDRAWQRRWFGWGRFGRNRVYKGWEGSDSSITDGAWIITLGVFGLVGFIAEFGLLALSVFRAATALKFVQTARERGYLAALALIVAVNIVDLLPNSSISPWTWLLVGALLGRAEALRAAAAQQAILRKSNLSPIGIQGREPSPT
jgi:hypothetical protein